MAEDYAATIADIRAEVAMRRQAQLEGEARQLYNEVREQQNLASEALARNDRTTAEYHVEEMNQKEQKLALVASQLPPPPREYTPAEQRKIAWMQRRPDLVANPQFQRTADWWHNYITSRGVPDGSKKYEEMMTTALEPQGYQPPINGDDVLKMVQSSKYGRGTTPQQFNRWVQQIQNRKAKGFYGG